MISSEAAIRSDADLAHGIERRISQRTWGRIHRLDVQVDEGRVAVRGCAPSYYVKQLTIQAVMEELESVPTDLDIQVEVV